MAGMFYTLDEVVEKLGKSEDEIKAFVGEGKLREFRDGENLLFKIDEVEALVPETAGLPEEAEALVAEVADAADLPEETFGATFEESSIELAPLEDSSEISLESDGTVIGPTEQQLTEADTSIGGEGINILGESSELPITDDTLGETQVSKAESQAESIEKLEEEVSLDSFGSGSGLLDLSLQADDTSLGADILEDIYSGEADQPGAASPVANDGMNMADEAEQIFSESEPEESAIAVGAMSTAAPVVLRAEPKADSRSNSFGIMLFVPLLAAIYTAIVAVAAFKGVTPAILTKAQAMIWYVAIGAAVLALIIMAAGLFFGGKTSKQ